MSATEDHLVTAVVESLRRSGHYDAVMDEATPDERQELQDALDRHTARGGRP